MDKEKIMMNDEQMDMVTGGTVIHYIVKPGDTLKGIARRFHVTEEQILKWNHIQNPNLLPAGQQLRILY